MRRGIGDRVGSETSREAQDQNSSREVLLDMTALLWVWVHRNKEVSRKDRSSG